MIIYWLLFAFFAFGALISGDRGERKLKLNPVFALGVFIMACVIGFRYRVGADWITYDLIFDFAKYGSFSEVAFGGDIGYQILNWLAHQLGFQVWFVNAVCAIIFCFGLSRFTRAQPEPWLAMTIAIPYLVIVVAMGYTRQGAAIGFILAALASRERGHSLANFFMYIFAAALFHKTSFIVIPLALFTTSGSPIRNFALAVVAVVAFYFAFLADSVDYLVRNYIEKSYESQGAYVRVFLCVVPAAFYLAFRRRFDFSKSRADMWRNFSVASFVSLGALALIDSSTAVDRVALYLIPLQIVILSRIDVFVRSKPISRIIVISAMGAVLFVWLNFAALSDAWKPYQHIFEEGYYGRI